MGNDAVYVAESFASVGFEAIGSGYPVDAAVSYVGQEALDARTPRP